MQFIIVEELRAFKNDEERLAETQRVADLLTGSVMERIEEYGELQAHQQIMGVILKAMDFSPVGVAAAFATFITDKAKAKILAKKNGEADETPVQTGGNDGNDSAA